MRLRFCLGILFCFHITLQSQVQLLQVGDEAPEIIGKNLEGTTFNLASYESELILLDFWAGWCRPCVKTIRDIVIPLTQKYDTKQLQVIGINYDYSDKKWAHFSEQFSVTWPQIRDEEYDVFKKYQLEVLPTYYLIDKEGKLVGVKIPSSELKQAIEAYLSSK